VSEAGLTVAIALIGRDELVGRIDRLVAERISVLLVGPSGAGKSALIDVIVRGVSCERVDPLEHISPMRAARLRRRLDAGVVMIGAARTLDRRQMGAVGRIAWRFRVVRVPPLTNTDMGEVIRRTLTADISTGAHADAWIRNLARCAGGLPGYGRALAEAGVSYWRRRGALPTLEWTVVEALTAGLKRDRLSD